MAFIEAYVTNLGKYNEGELASEPLKFPTTTEEVQALLKRIGVDNIQYEEIFIADYGGDLPELNACLGEYLAGRENQVRTLRLCSGGLESPKRRYLPAVQAAGR